MSQDDIQNGSKPPPKFPTSNRWLKEKRTTLVSNVRPETRATFDLIHEELVAQGRTKSREDTVVYLCMAYMQQEKIMNTELTGEDLPNLLNGAVYADKASALAVVAYLETHYGIYGPGNADTPPTGVRVDINEKNGLFFLEFNYLP